MNILNKALKFSFKVNNGYLTEFVFWVKYEVDITPCS